jgi:hypothetical protein
MAAGELADFYGFWTFRHFSTFHVSRDHFREVTKMIETRDEGRGSPSSVSAKALPETEGNPLAGLLL